jgi:hypothetical protein
MLTFPTTDKECADYPCKYCGASIYTEHCLYPGKRKSEEREA